MKLFFEAHEDAAQIGPRSAAARENVCVNTVQPQFGDRGREGAKETGRRRDWFKPFEFCALSAMLDRPRGERVNCDTRQYRESSRHEPRAGDLYRKRCQGVAMH